MVKFKQRQYPEEVLSSCLEKAKLVNREEILKPKTKYLISNLLIHNPNILLKYGITCNPEMDICNDNVFIVFPFYKNIARLGNIVIEALREGIEECEDEVIKATALNLNIKVAYKKTNSLAMFLR